MSRKLFVGGNWKLNPTTQAQVKSLVETLNGGSWTDAVGKEPSNPFLTKISVNCYSFF